MFRRRIFSTWPTRRSLKYFNFFCRVHIPICLFIVDAIVHKNRIQFAEAKKQWTLFVLQHSPWNSIKFIFIGWCILYGAATATAIAATHSPKQTHKKRTNSMLKAKWRKGNEKIKRIYTSATARPTIIRIEYECVFFVFFSLLFLRNCIQTKKERLHY